MFMHALSAIYCMLTHAPPSPKKRKHRQKTDTGTSTSKQRTCSRVRGYRKKTPNGKGGSQSYTFPLPRSRVSCFCTVLCSCTPTAVLPYCRYTRRPPHTPLPGGGRPASPCRASSQVGRDRQERGFSQDDPQEARTSYGFQEGGGAPVAVPFAWAAPTIFYY